MICCGIIIPTKELKRKLTSPLSFRIDGNRFSLDFYEGSCENEIDKITNLLYWPLITPVKWNAIVVDVHLHGNTVYFPRGSIVLHRNGCEIFPRDSMSEILKWRDVSVNLTDRSGFIFQKHDFGLSISISI